MYSAHSSMSCLLLSCAVSAIRRPAGVGRPAGWYRVEAWRPPGVRPANAGPGRRGGGHRHQCRLVHCGPVVRQPASQPASRRLSSARCDSTAPQPSTSPRPATVSTAPRAAWLAAGWCGSGGSVSRPADAGPHQHCAAGPGAWRRRNGAGARCPARGGPPDRYPRPCPFPVSGWHRSGGAGEQDGRDAVVGGLLGVLGVQAGAVGPLSGDQPSHRGGDQEGGDQPGHDRSLGAVTGAPQRIMVGPQSAQPPARHCRPRCRGSLHPGPLGSYRRARAPRWPRGDFPARPGRSSHNPVTGAALGRGRSQTPARGHGLQEWPYRPHRPRGCVLVALPPRAACLRGLGAPAAAAPPFPGACRS